MVVIIIFFTNAIYSSTRTRKRFACHLLILFQDKEEKKVSDKEKGNSYIGNTSFLMVAINMYTVFANSTINIFPRTGKRFACRLLILFQDNKEKKVSNKEKAVQDTRY
jgi:hypothetical protein